jgi:GTP-binding protein
MFTDSVRIHVKGGAGGRGCHSVYTDKYTRQGIIDGGDGGRGADIVLRVDRNLRTLLDFRYNRDFCGRHGEHGSGKNKRGKDAPTVYVRVPPGTIVKDALNGSVLRDLDRDGEELVVARGGKGGLGNQHHCDPTPGEPGEEKYLLFDLKLLADAGVIGFPNAGKSTFVRTVSNAKPAVAAYPFTTKVPVLGMVRNMDESFVIADIPGLIEGSSQGRGLGDQFLRHVERTRVLVHVIDMGAQEGRDPVNDYKILNRELAQYSTAVRRKPQVLVANKMDLEGARKNLTRFKKAVRRRIYPISALNREGIEDVVEAIYKKLRDRSR